MSDQDDPSLPFKMVDRFDKTRKQKVYDIVDKRTGKTESTYYAEDVGLKAWRKANRDAQKNEEK